MASPVPEPERAEEEALRLVAEHACSSVGCVAAGVTVVQGDHELIVGSSLLGHQLEQVQWETDQGPGVDAVRQLQVFNVACLVTTTSWPDFVAFATGRGVRSCLAVPIILRGRALGALDLYSLDPQAFEGAEQVGLHYATRAALALSTLGAGRGGALPRPAPHPAGPGRSQAVS